jgi:hypothetical protein
MILTQALEYLEREVCTTWPDGHCYSFLALWGRLLSDEEKVFDRNDLEMAEDMIFIKLCCVQRHCPDVEIRFYARDQLRKEFWDRQKAKSPMDH